MAFALGRTLLVTTTLTDWSFEYFLLYRSYHLSQGLFVWSPRNLTSVRENLDAEYGTEITFTTVMLGSCGAVLSLCSNLIDYVIRDFTLVVTWTVYAIVNRFHHNINQTLCQSDGRTLAENIKHYLQLKNTSDSINKAVGGLFKLIHINNLLSIAYLLLQYLRDDSLSGDVILLTVDGIKILWTYYLAVSTYETVRNFSGVVLLSPLQHCKHVCLQ